MRMEDDLPRVLAIVHRDIYAVGAHSFLYRDRDRAYRFRDREPVFLRDIENVVRMRFRYDERVSRVHWSNVEESENGVALIDLKAGEVIPHDLAKYTIRVHV